MTLKGIQVNELELFIQYKYVNICISQPFSITVSQEIQMLYKKQTKCFSTYIISVS